MKVRALEGTYSSFVWNRSGQPKPPTNGRDGPRGEARAKGAGGTGSLIAAEPSQRGGGRLPHLLESRRQRLVVEHVCVLRHVVPDVIEVEEGVGCGGLMWPPAPPPAPCSLPAPPRGEPSGACGRAAAVSAWAGPGGGVPGVGGRGGDGGGGRKDPTGTLAPPRPPPGVGWPSRPRAGRHRKQEPPTRPEARRTAVRRQATSATTTSRGAGRHCGPCSPPGLSPTPPTGGGWVGLACPGGPAPPTLGRGWGAGRGAPAPPRGRLAGCGRRGGAAEGLARRRRGVGGWRTLMNLLGAVRVGASLSLARGDAVGSWGGVLVGQSAKKKMSSSPRGSGQRGARR